MKRQCVACGRESAGRVVLEGTCMSCLAVRDTNIPPELYDQVVDECMESAIIALVLDHPQEFNDIIRAMMSQDGLAEDPFKPKLDRWELATA